MPITNHVGRRTGDHADQYPHVCARREEQVRAQHAGDAAAGADARVGLVRHEQDVHHPCQHRACPGTPPPGRR